MVDRRFRRRPRVEGQVRTRIWYATQRGGLEMPFPTSRIVAVPPGPASDAVDEHARTLAQVELFAPLEPADRELLATGMREVRFCVGERIIRQGDPGDSLFIITDGVVGVRLAADGLEREVARLAPGEIFGEMSLVTGESRQASCTAETEVVCRVVDQKAFRRLLEARPQVADDISAILAARQADLADERHQLSAVARNLRAEQAKSRLLSRIRAMFQLV